MNLWVIIFRIPNIEHAIICCTFTRLDWMELNWIESEMLPVSEEASGQNNKSKGSNFSIAAIMGHRMDSPPLPLPAPADLGIRIRGLRRFLLLHYQFAHQQLYIGPTYFLYLTALSSSGQIRHILSYINRTRFCLTFQQISKYFWNLLWIFMIAINTYKKDELPINHISTRFINITLTMCEI